MASKNYGPKKFYKINQYITASTVRLLDEEGKQIGVMSIEEARAQSRDTGLDLVEVSGMANPPVIKLIEFSKFKYQEAKKQKSEKKGIKGGDTKEIQMTPFIGPGDYETRVKWGQKFLSTGNKVKISIKFQGRQITHKEFGYDLIQKYKKDLGDNVLIEGEPRLMGKRLIATLTATKKVTSKDNETELKETQN